MGNRFRPDFLVTIDSVVEIKRRMLACHKSQLTWLQSTQNMDAGVAVMEEFCRTMAQWGNLPGYAESWRRHWHLGFCDSHFDPLPEYLRGFVRQPTV